MDVVGELEGEVECFDDLVVVELVALEEAVGGLAFAADALLFFAEDVV